MRVPMRLMTAPALPADGEQAAEAVDAPPVLDVRDVLSPVCGEVGGTAW